MFLCSCTAYGWPSIIWHWLNDELPSPSRLTQTNESHICVSPSFFREIHHSTECHQVNSGGAGSDSSASCAFVDEVKQLKHPSVINSKNLNIYCFLIGCRKKKPWIDATGSNEIVETIEVRVRETGPCDQNLVLIVGEILQLIFLPSVTCAGSHCV